MTVCIGAIFRWNYAPVGEPPQRGAVVLALSDRMITAGDIEYEPIQKKVAFLTPHIILLIAGDYTVHSQALKVVQSQIKRRDNLTPYNVAMMYGAAIQAIQRKAAEDIYLAPLGLNTDSFLAQQTDMAPHFVDNITNQLQSYGGADVAALIMGIGDGAAHLYEVDKYGRVHCHDDVGFAAIGIGSYHANSVMMQAGFINNWTLAPALWLMRPKKQQKPRPASASN